MSLWCFGSGESAESRNAEINKQIKQDEKQSSKEVKMLLLGAGESGKSTVLKQMRLIHTKGFTDAERLQWKVIILSNIINAFQCISIYMEEVHLQLGSPENAENLKLAGTEVEMGTESALPPRYREVFLALWRDTGVQEAISKGYQYALHDNLSYFIDSIDRLFSDDYIPIDQDILRARLRTTGISETLFNTGDLTYRMFDVGGQRSERKKWIHVFDNVQAVLFMVAISGFDQALVEDRNGNQMQEALMLFESISNSKYFIHAGLVLFLNKMDLFIEKIEGGGVRIAEYFPDYKGPDSDSDAGAKFFASKFKGLIRNPKKEVYVHQTTATDTDLLKKTMVSVQDMVIQKNINSLIVL